MDSNILADWWVHLVLSHNIPNTRKNIGIVHWHHELWTWWATLLAMSFS